MSDAATQTLYSNQIVLAQEIDRVAAEQGDRIRTLEDQIKNLNALLMYMRRQDAKLERVLSEGVHGEFTSAAVARGKSRNAQSRIVKPCDTCS